MAAVDVDVGEIKRVAKVRAAAARGRGEPGLFWSGEQDEEIHIHERVVCSIKAHQNGTLEIAPGRVPPISEYSKGVTIGELSPKGKP